MAYTRTAILLAGMTALFLAAGYLVGGMNGAFIALAVACGMNLFAWWNSDRMVLSMYGARQVDREAAPTFYATVEQLAANADLPMPKVFVIESDQPNAFATGRNPENAAVAATTGLLQRLSPEEVAGVMAHELAHVRSRDTLVMTVTATLAGAIGMLANFAFLFGAFRGNDNRNGLGAVGTILVALLAPIAAMLVQMAISRSREYEADRVGAEISGRPLWLASALEKIEQAAHNTEIPQAERNPATAHMFIVNPLHGGGIARLFSSHPGTAERVARLREMAGTASAAKGPWG